MITLIRRSQGSTKTGLILFFFLFPFIAFSQGHILGQFPTMDGGFENQASSGTASLASTPFGSAQSVYTTNNSNVGATFQGTGGRSGPQYIKFTTTAAAQGLYTPTAAIAASTSYVVQYYYQFPSTFARNFVANASADGGSSFSASSTAISPNGVSSWTQATQIVTTPSNVANGFGIVKLSPSGGGTTGISFFVDDIVVYAGALADITAPGAATSPIISNASSTSQSLSWTAPAGGVDGGGYVVVRYAASPAASDDPNQNGVYAIGNSVAGSVTGTVVYIGTATSCTSSSLTSNTTYYYNIYTVDKAFNYASELSTSLVTNCSTPTVSSTSPGSRCATGTVALGAAFSAGTLNWYAASSGGSSLGTGTTFTTPSISSTTTYYVDATNGSCVSARSSVIATVHALPTPTISAGSTTTFCSGCSVTLTSSAASSYSWSTSATSSSIVVSSTGSYTVTVTDANGCQGTSSATGVTVNTCTGHTWTGATSSNWSTASNWNKCAAPGTTDDVTIPNVATAPVISTSANCRNLTINASASLTINSGNTFNVYGNITNNGTYTGNGTCILTGSSAQSVTGAIAFNNLTLTNAAGATLNNATTVNGILTLTSGTLASGGNLTVNLNTGAIDGSGSGTISGTITIIKTVNSNKYHMISSPLSGQTANDWNDDITIKSGRYANLFSYDETNTDTTITTGWTAQTSLSTALTSLKGFALYFYGATSLDQTGTYNHSDTYTSPSLTNTISTINGVHKATSDGWNLVGNPYPSALDWNAASGWTKTGLDNAIYCWDGVNSRYTSYITGSGTNGGTQYIPSMQAFWVKVTSPGTGSLAMTNSVRVTSTNPAIWRTTAASHILKLTAGSGGYSDETIIRFRNDAQETFDSQLDAYKMDNEDNTPNLYTELHNDQYSINSLPDTSKKISVPVKLNAAFTGTYTFTAEETGSFDAGDSIIFEDRLLGVKQDLRANAAYTCSVTQGDTSGRFYINFRKASTLANFNTPVVPSMTVNSFDENIKIKFFNESSNRASIGIYNTLGQEEFKIEEADISSKEYSILLSKGRSGVYIVKVVTSSQSHSGKVYLFK